MDGLYKIGAEQPVRDSLSNIFALEFVNESVKEMLEDIHTMKRLWKSDRRRS